MCLNDFSRECPLLHLSEHNSNTMAISNHRKWLAWQKSYELSGRIFNITKQFPKEERYSLTDQIRRSSRSVTANIAEAGAKIFYPKHFVSKLSDSVGENYETQTWLAFALAAEYITPQTYKDCIALSEEVGRLLNYMQYNHEKFTKGSHPINKPRNSNWQPPT